MAAGRGPAKRLPEIAPVQESMLVEGSCGELGGAGVPCSSLDWHGTPFWLCSWDIGTEGCHDASVS